ncbi:hypothetical protein K461DRAFT_313631 [Myriangium duriaei CBS 260.36]|uniref:Uncharacterized protein n=1 Tax=Myriangium duriaei CBS 260.36 TaxID=1168546 RepID=A0A9P4IXP4_9PEZI|nr:hypothetical protein K461DRAFT_313631 [Myriangium duriaei CBS 260.36]
MIKRQNGAKASCNKIHNMIDRRTQINPGISRSAIKMHFFLLVTLFLTSAFAAEVINCHNDERIGVLKNQFKSPQSFCLWYNTGTRPNSPLQHLNAQEVTQICACILGTPAVRRPVPIVPIPREYVKRCSQGYKSILSAQANQPKQFCQFWNQADWRNSSPFQRALTVSQLYNACECYKAVTTTTTRTTTTTAQTTTTTRAKPTTTTTTTTTKSTTSTTTTTTTRSPSTTTFLTSTTISTTTSAMTSPSTSVIASPTTTTTTNAITSSTTTSTTTIATTTTTTAPLIIPSTLVATATVGIGQQALVTLQLAQNLAATSTVQTASLASSLTSLAITATATDDVTAAASTCAAEAARYADVANPVSAELKMDTAAALPVYSCFVYRTTDFIAMVDSGDSDITNEWVYNQAGPLINVAI